jgi:hypothetical protein
MNDYMSKLTLERGVAFRPRWNRAAVQVGGLQWSIDGKPLALTLQEARPLLPKEGRRLTADLYYSVLQRRKDFYGDAGRDALRFLLGEDEWEEFPDRVPLLIGQCLHVECAVISAVIERQDDAVTWGQFRAHQPGPDVHGYLFPPTITYTFNREEHDCVLRATQAQISVNE